MKVNRSVVPQPTKDVEILSHLCKSPIEDAYRYRNGRSCEHIQAPSYKNSIHRNHLCPLPLHKVPISIKQPRQVIALTLDDGGGQWDASAIHPTTGAWRAGLLLRWSGLIDEALVPGLPHTQTGRAPCGSSRHHKMMSQTARRRQVTVASLTPPQIHTLAKQASHSISHTALRG